LDLSTFLVVLSGKNKKLDFIFLTNDLIDSRNDLWFQKTSNISRIIPNFRSFYSGINAKINELSGDMHLVAQYLVLEEIFAYIGNG
jgi:hypothetical protein